jgi:hypothetical protein
MRLSAVKKLSLALLAAILYGACSTSLVREINPDVYQRRDMEIRVAGKTALGVTVAPRALVYQFEIKTPGNLDWFTLKTCHREWSLEKAGNVKVTKPRWPWGEKTVIAKNQVKFRFANSDQENIHEYCPMVLAAFEKKRGRHSFGFVDFDNIDDPLPGTLYCNGDKRSVGGVSVCQSRVGLIQSIVFGEKIKHEAEGGCPGGEAKGNTFTHESGRGRCVYLFVGLASGRLHRHTSIGYESIIFKEQ